MRLGTTVRRALAAFFLAMVVQAAAGASPARVQISLEKLEQKHPGYTFEITSPRATCASHPAAARRFNEVVRAFVRGEIATFEKFVREQAPRVGKPTDWYLNYETTRHTVSGDFVSVYMQGDSFSGGAHGSHPVYTLMFDMKLGRALKLRELFRPGSPWLKTLSRLAVAELLTRDLDPATVREGAGPKEGNFKCFYLEGNHLVLLFPEYQVGPYVAGQQEVSIPLASLRSLAAARSPIPGR